MDSDSSITDTKLNENIENNLGTCKNAFLWNIGKPAIKRLESRFPRLKLKNKTFQDILKKWRGIGNTELSKVGNLNNLILTLQTEDQSDTSNKILVHL